MEVFDPHYKIRINSKKLKSGRFQVKFYAQVDGEKLYGYMLVNPEETLKTVVGQIRNRLIEIEDTAPFHGFIFNPAPSINTKNTELMIFNHVNS